MLDLQGNGVFSNSEGFAVKHSIGLKFTRRENERKLNRDTLS